MSLYFPQVYIIIALWLHIFSKLVSLVVFRCTETKVVSELIQLENSCRREAQWCYVVLVIQVEDWVLFMVYVFSQAAAYRDISCLWVLILLIYVDQLKTKQSSFSVLGKVDFWLFFFVWSFWVTVKFRFKYLQEQHTCLTLNPKTLTRM